MPETIPDLLGPVLLPSSAASVSSSRTAPRPQGLIGTRSSGPDRVGCKSWRQSPQCL